MAKRGKLKLFVWKDFCPDYRGGLAVAVARDEAEARSLVEKEAGKCVFHDWGTLTVHPLSRKYAAYVLGGG